MADQRLSPEVAGILKNSTATATSIILPPAQLPPALYKAVDKALRNIGGKWHTKARAHLFTSDPRPKLAQALDTGIATDQKKTYQSFYTPEPLAREIALLADVKSRKVLEPSAGEGALADACRHAGAGEVTCFEIRSEACRVLEAKGHTAACADFLTLQPAPIYDRVVMNPPFANNQDVKHVEHALLWLKPKGTLVAIMPNSQRRAAFQSLTADREYEIRELERGTFKDSGTNVATLLLTVYAWPY